MSVNSSQDDGGESGVSGTFNNIYIFPLGGWEGASLGVADFNGDGRNDIVLASFRAED